MTILNCRNYDYGSFFLTIPSLTNQIDSILSDYFKKKKK